MEGAIAKNCGEMLFHILKGKEYICGEELGGRLIGQMDGIRLL